MRIYAVMALTWANEEKYVSRGTVRGRAALDKPDFWSDRERAEQVAAQCGGKVEEWEAGPVEKEHTRNQAKYGLSALSDRSGK